MNDTPFWAYIESAGSEVCLTIDLCKDVCTTSHDTEYVRRTLAYCFQRLWDDKVNVQLYADVDYQQLCNEA